MNLSNKNISVLCIVLMLFGIFPLSNPHNANASSTQDIFQVTVSFPTGTNTWAATGGYLSSNASLTPTNSTIKVSDYVTDPTKLANITSVTLTPPSGTVSYSPSCSSSSCSTGNMSGQSISVTTAIGSGVSGTQSYPGYFDWWRNGFGSTIWSYDDSDSATHYDYNGTGGCDPLVSSAYYSGACPQLYPSSGNWPNKATIDPSTATFVMQTSGTIVANSLVNVTGVMNGAGVSPTVATITNTSLVNGKAVVSFDLGPFNKNGTDLHIPSGSDTVRARRWTFQVQADFTGITYFYPNKWTLTVNYNGATPTPTPTPTATPTATPVGATPTPTPVATPSPAPTCSTPVSINAIIPSTAKAGQPFYVSGSGSKDSSGGTNLSYQWYYQATSGGSLVIGPSTRDATLNISTQGSYRVYLDITDNSKTICSAQTSNTVNITPPSPDADVTVTGKLEANRPLVIDSSSSNSPSAYPITSRSLSIAPLNGALASDMVTLQSLSGTTKVDTMLRKPGDYNISNTVCNTLSLCDTKTIKITIVADLNPVGDIQGGTIYYRDPANTLIASVNLNASINSPDGDSIGSSNATIVYDKNNDGNFADDLAANSFAASLNLITGKISFNASKVGTYLVILYGCETFNPGPFASYLTSTDYKCTNPGATFTTLIDNQAPTTSLSAQKTYKTDIALNIGDISIADQNYLKNNISSWTATLRAKGIDANITVGTWNKNFEPDYLKDTGTFMTTMNWRTNLDKKYLIGITNSTSNITQGTFSLPLDLKPIPVSSAPFEGRVLSAKATGRNVYMVYQYPMGSTSDYSIYYASGPVGSMSKQSLGYQYTSANAYPYNAYASVQLDTNNNPYVMVSHDPSPSDNVFHQGYHLFYPSQGIWDKRMDTSPASNSESQPTQIFSRMSSMKTGPAIWSTAGIFYMDTWIQSQNYFRRPSNNWVPNTYPDYYTMPQQQLETYSVGYTVNNNEYWFGTMDFNQNYLFLNYNGTKSYFNQYSGYVNDGLVSGNSVIVFATKKVDATLYKLTFTNGLLVSEIKLNTTPQGSIMKINPNTGKLYMLMRNWDSTLHLNKDSIAEFDYVNNVAVWTKAVAAGYSILDVSFDSDGVTPLYLFSSSNTNMVYLSKDGDTSLTSNDTLTSRSTEANATTAYNENGEYAWFTQETNGDSSGNVLLYKIHKIDPNGLYTNATILKPYTTVLYGISVLANNDIVAIGMDTALGYFYALDSENYVKHYSKPAGFSNYIVQYSPNKIYMDVNDRVSFTVTDENNLVWAYNINFVTKNMDYIGNLRLRTSINDGTAVSTNAYSIVPINNSIHSVSYVTTIDNLSSTGSFTLSADGVNLNQSFTFGQYNNGIDSSIDANSSNNFFAIATLHSGTNGTDFFFTNLPGFPASGSAGAIAGYYSAVVKFINDVPYAYARRTPSSAVEIFAIGYTAVNSFKFIQFNFVGYIQNTNVFPDGWVGHSSYAYSGSYTNLPTAKTDPGIPSYTIPTNFNGTDSYFNTGSNLHYDNVTGGFASMNLEFGTNDIINGVFYDSTLNKYVKQVFNASGNGNHSQFSYSKGNFYFGLYQYSLYNGNNVINSVNMYKMDKNGTTNFYNFTVPNQTMTINNVSFTQDENGYIYGIVVAAPYTNYQGTVAYVITNKSGTFQTYTYSLGGYVPNLSDLSVNHGKFMFGNAYPGSYEASRIYYVDVANLTTSSSFISKAISATNVYSFKNLQFDPDSNNIFFEGQGYRGDNANPRWNSIMFNYNIVDNSSFYINQFGYGDNFVIDKNNIFIADNTTIYKYNKFTMMLMDVGRKAPVSGSNYFALNSRGKMIGINFDTSNKAIVTVYNSIDISQNDPSLSTVVGGQTISSVFVGPQTIKPAVDYLVTLSNGQFMDSSQFVNAQAIMDGLTNYLNTNIKQQAGTTVYYVLGDQLNMSGVYSDYESDTKQAEKYKLYHNPAIFDNNQGIITNNGQSQTTPYVLDHVGAYTGYYIAQDNPTYGNAALAPFSKWSAEDTPITFIVHRKPFAVFNPILRDNPNDATTVLFSITEASYDLDHNISDPVNKGIVSKDWKYKDASTATWIAGLPPSVLPKNTNYDLVLTVTDQEGATSKASTTFYTGNTTPNHLPVTDITNIISTDPNNPDIVSLLTPTYQWNYTDADGDPQQKYWLYVFDASNNIVSTSNEVISNAKSYIQSPALAQNTLYSVQVKANDGIAYGNLSPKKYFKIITNRPPTGNLTFITPIYQNDTPTFTITQSDPDNDPLTIKVDARFNGGGYINIKSWSGIPSGTQKVFTYGPLAQGVYSISLTLDDGKGGVNTQVYSFTALPLAITGAVNHTIDWESNRQQWNLKFPLKLHALNDFWAGEAFELVSIVTNTGTSVTKPQSVTATLLQTGDIITLSSRDNVNFSGEMLNTSFIHSLKDGSYTMRFQVRWTNGLIQTADVPFNIKGNIFDVLVVQNRN